MGLTDDEHRRLIERAIRDRVPLSRLLVETTLAEKPATSEQKTLSQDLIDRLDWAVTQVVRAGNNLNQFVTKLSQRKAVSQ